MKLANVIGAAAIALFALTAAPRTSAAADIGRGPFGKLSLKVVNIALKSYAAQQATPRMTLQGQEVKKMTYGSLQRTWQGEAAITYSKDPEGVPHDPTFIYQPKMTPAYFVGPRISAGNVLKMIFAPQKAAEQITFSSSPIAPR